MIKNIKYKCIIYIRGINLYVHIILINTYAYEFVIEYIK